MEINYEVVMSKEAEITFMQTRLIRLASEEWHLPIEQIIKKCAKRKQMIFVSNNYYLIN